MNFDTATVCMYGSDDPDREAVMMETHEANAAIISVAALAFDLARKVSNLNPKAGEIGEGMLRTIQSAAFEIVETAVANHVLITARTRRINAHKDHES